MVAGVVVDVHHQHLLALRTLVRVLTRPCESAEVALHPVATVESIDTDDAELPLRSFPRKLLVDSAIPALADWPRIIRHVSTSLRYWITAILSP